MGTGPVGSVFGEKTRGVAMWQKCSSDPRQAYLEVKLQGRDLLRVAGIVGPFVPLRVGMGMGTADLCRVPLAADRHGRARQTSGTRPCGDCRRVLWVLGPRDQCSGKTSLIVKPGVQDEGGPRVAKPSFEPQGRNGHKWPVPGAPSTGSPRESQANFIIPKYGVTCAGFPWQRFATGEPCG